MADRAWAFRWLVFLVLVLVWPMPLLGLEGSFVPVARFVQLAASLSILIALEGAGGMVGVLVLLLWGHVLVHGALLFGVSWLLVRVVLRNSPSPVRIAVLVGLVFAVLLWVGLGRPYDTIFHHSDAHASLLELYR